MKSKEYSESANESAAQQKEELTPFNEEKPTEASPPKAYENMGECEELGEEEFDERKDLAFRGNNLIDKYKQLKQNFCDKDFEIPPPISLIKKSAIENEPVKTGAPIAFIKFARLQGKEFLEGLNPDNKKSNEPLQPTATDISHSQTINDYMLNARDVNRLVYCRFGEKYLNDLEKRKNSNISSINQPTLNLSSASYLINIKKLVEEHNIEGERRDFKQMKSGNMGKMSQS